jgi:hypothetical protein
MYSKGVSWIDDCRIPFVDEGDKNERVNQEKSRKSSHIRDGFMNTIVIPQIEQTGRFPANILVSDDMLNDGVINGGGSYSGIKTRERIKFFNERGVMNSTAQSPDNYGDKGSNSRYYNIDKWFENLIK